MATAEAEVLSEYRTVLTEMERRGLAPPEPFRSFVGRHNPTLLDFEHVPRLVSVADRLARGDLKRVLVLLPPRLFKTETFSRLLGAYFLRQNPEGSVGLVSYTGQVAWDISVEARDYYQEDGGEVSEDTSAKSHWKTSRGGEMWAAGVGGPLLGRGYDLGIVDDPTDPEKAHSPTYQRRFRQWWPAKFLSRQEPGARIVVVMQRLGMDDPIDWLFRREVGEDTERAPEKWHVVACDEIHSEEPLGRWDGPKGLPETCTLEPDPREVGEILAPSRFDRAQVDKLQRGAADYVTSAQRQQRPLQPGGDFWRKEWFRTYEKLPADAYDGGKDWDTAYTKDEANSASAYMESYRGPGPTGEFPIYIHDLGWEWREFPGLVAWMEDESGPHYVESRASGKSAVQALARQGVTAQEVPVEGDKFSRAAGVQPVVSNGRVYVRDEVYEKLLRGERQGLLRVTAEQLQQGQGELDVNDAFVQALHRHTGGRPTPTVSPGKGLKRKSPWSVGGRR